MKKHHEFKYTGEHGFIGSICGIKEKNGVIYNSGKLVNCYRCLKIKKPIKK